MMIFMLFHVVWGEGEGGGGGGAGGRGCEAAFYTKECDVANEGGLRGATHQRMVHVGAPRHNLSPVGFSAFHTPVR